jgi:hypothetical protein
MAPSWIGCSGPLNNVSTWLFLSFGSVLESDDKAVGGAKEVTDAVDDAAADIPVVGVVLDCGVVVVLVSVGVTGDADVETTTPAFGIMREFKRCDCAAG